jgi:hypothetical protein
MKQFPKKNAENKNKLSSILSKSTKMKSTKIVDKNKGKRVAASKIQC